MHNSIIKQKSFQILVLALLLLPFSSYSEKEEDTSASHSEDQNPQNKKVEPTIVNESLNPFITGGPTLGLKTSFDPNKLASRAFQEECREQYPSFRYSVGQYLQAVQSPVGSSYSDRGQTMGYQLNQAKTKIEQCAGNLHDSYTRLLQKIANSKFQYEQIVKLGTNNKARDSSNSYLKEIHSQMSKWRNDFETRCVHFIRNKTYGYGQEKISYGGSKAPGDRGGGFGAEDLQGYRESLVKFGGTLEDIQRKNCSADRGKFEKFFNGEAWQALVALPGKCQKPAGCVERLRKLAGLDLRADEMSLFQACTKKHDNTSHCCFANHDKCEGAGTDFYQSLLNSSSTEGEVCSSDQARQAKSSIENKLLQVCAESSNKCINLCQNQGFAQFKEEFLKCFFLTGLKEESYSLHNNSEGNMCWGQIQEIKVAFNKGLKEAYWNKDSNGSNKLSTLEGFYTNDQGINNFRESCGKHLQALKKNEQNIRQASVDRVYAGGCQNLLAEKETEKTSEEDRQIATHASTAGVGVGGYGGRGSGDRSRRSPGSGGGSGSASSYNRGLNFSPQGSVPGQIKIGGGDLEQGASDDSSFDNLDPMFFSSKAGKGEGSESSGNSTFESKFKGDKYEYRGPRDPFAPKPYVTSYPYKKAGPVPLDEAVDEDEKNSEENPTFWKQVSSPHYGIVDDDGFPINSDSSGVVGGFRGFVRNARSKINKTLRKGYMALFGDSTQREHLRKVLEVNGPEVDLMERQKELILQWCEMHNECHDW